MHLFPAPYDVPVFVVLIAFLIIGIASGTHIRLFRGDIKNRLTKIEKDNLRLPGVWLTSSMWLNYLNNLVLGGSVIFSIDVIIISCFSPEDNVRIIVYTTISLACSLLYNFTHAKEKSEGYREAANHFRQFCEIYEYKHYSSELDNCSSESKLADLEKLLIERKKCELIIETAHKNPEKYSAERDVNSVEQH